MSNNKEKEVEFREVTDMTRMVPAVEAGLILGYTADYITKLARDKKILGEKVGRSWVVDIESAKSFKEKNEREKKLRNEKIRQERLKEQQTFRQVPVEEEQEDSEVPSHNFSREARVALTHTLAIMFLGLMVGIGGYAVTKVATPHQEASAWTTVESLARALYGVITPEDEVQVRIPAPDTVTTHTALIVAPDEVMTETTIKEIRDSFSDDVSISVDPNNPDTGIIVPSFRDRAGDEYRFLIAPIQTP